jgi:hypothetical protein
MERSFAPRNLGRQRLIPQSLKLGNFLSLAFRFMLLWFFYTWLPLHVVCIEQHCYKGWDESFGVQEEQPDMKPAAAPLVSRNSAIVCVSG